MRFKIFRSSLCFSFVYFLMNTNSAYAENSTSNEVDYGSKWSAYSDNIKNCTPGVFQLPNVVLISMLKMAQQANSSTAVPSLSSIPPITYTILGWQSGKCQVKVTQMMPNEGASPSQETVTMTCHFSQDQLQTLADSAAQLASGSFSISTDDQTSKIMSQACPSN
jgi:hypothetical protein